MNKIWPGFEEAVADIGDGATVMMHNFLSSGGVSQNLIKALAKQGTKDLTVISCNFLLGWFRGKPTPDVVTPSLLVQNRQVKRVVTGVIGSSVIYGCATPLQEQIVKGEVEAELVPQGTLAERIRAGGCGLGPFYCPVGVDTILAEKKEKRTFNGRQYVLEYPLRADFAFVRAYKADKLGNLICKGTSRAYNPLIAMAANISIAEVDEIVEIGELDPETIAIPGIFIHRIVKVP